MPELNEQYQPAVQHGMITSLAHGDGDLLEAMRLRCKVFAEEVGANPPTLQPGVDRDIFDKYCDHLVVRDRESLDVIGTSRLLSPSQARKIGGYCLQTEFDLTRLLHLRERMLESGRDCVHRNYRNRTTIDHLLTDIVQYMRQNRHDYLIGSINVGIADGGHLAASLYRKLYRLYGAPIEYRVFPRNPLPEGLNPYLDAPVPPLLKGYLRLGSWICGEPSWNPDFNTAAIPILLPISRLANQ